MRSLYLLAVIVQAIAFAADRKKSIVTLNDGVDGTFGDGCSGHGHADKGDSGDEGESELHCVGVAVFRSVRLG